ncbi:MAG: hypothetical protein IJZ50_01210 [Alistipes sp.]|nr:hypothetical protein [Alistipes sp.]
MAFGGCFGFVVPLFGCLLFWPLDNTHAITCKPKSTISSKIAYIKFQSNHQTEHLEYGEPKPPILSASKRGGLNREQHRIIEATFVAIQMRCKNSDFLWNKKIIVKFA